MFTHLCADFLQFGGSGFSRIFFFIEPDFFRGKGRAVGPYHPGKVGVRNQCDIFLFQCFRHFFSRRRRYGASVYAHTASLRQRRKKEFFNGRDSGLLHFIEIDTGSGKLILRLEKIPSVCPQSRPVSCDRQRSGRTGKARKPATEFKMIAGVFRKMIIGGRDIVRVQTALLHGRAERFQTAADDIG